MALTPEQLEAAMAGIRSQVLDAIEAHERAAHAGQPCWLNRAGIIGYLAHSVGLTDAELPMLGTILRNYTATCRSTTCRHRLTYQPEPQE
jgi:hypothetical protein